MAIVNNEKDRHTDRRNADVECFSPRWNAERNVRDIVRQLGTQTIVENKMLLHTKCCFSSKNNTKQTNIMILSQFDLYRTSIL